MHYPGFSLSLVSLPPLPEGWTEERANAMIDSEDFSSLTGLTSSDALMINDYMNERARPAREAGEAALAAYNAAPGLPPVAERRATDDEYTNNESTDDESTDDESTDDESTDDESTDDESTDDEYTDDEFAHSLGLRDGTKSYMWNIAELFGRDLLDSWDSWGFVAVKSTCYAQSDKARWEEYKMRLQQCWDDKMSTAYGATPGEGLAARFQIIWIEDEALDGATIEVARQHYKSRREVDKIPWAHDVELFLLVDEGSVASLLDNDGNGTPYVMGVDRMPPPEEEECREGLGYFKVAVHSIPVQLWLYLWAGAVPEELEPAEGWIYPHIKEV